MDPLDNPAWHALTGPHAKVAEGGNLARRYPPEYAPWCALHPDAGAAAWDELADVVGPDGVALLSGPPTEMHGWEAVGRFPVLQLVLDTEVAEGPSDVVVALDSSHAEAMTQLARSTEPGPWAECTHELGNFFGVFEQGALVAMGGGRLHLPTATEISAVCTAPSHRGRGLAAALVASVVRDIQARGELAFLHVRANNQSAIRVYERLGFRTRVHTEVALLRPPPPGDA